MQDDTYTESYISTIGVDFVSTIFFKKGRQNRHRPCASQKIPFI